MNVALLRDEAFRAFFTAAFLLRFGVSVLTVVLGLQVYAIAHDPLDLGWLGLAEAIPGVTLVLYGGHVADRHDRGRIVVLASAALGLIALGLAWVSAGPAHPPRLALFAAAFLAGVMRAFESPAAAGLEAQVVPADGVIGGLALLATSGRVADVLGSLAGGLAFAALGPAETDLGAAALFLGAALALALARGPIARRAPVRSGADLGEGALRRIGAGVRTVFADQVLWGSMALDLFAVFFGGATALLPAVATDLLGVGPVGFGFLRASMGAGSLTAAVFAARLLPLARAGVALHAVIAGFGLAMIVFGLSRSLPLSIAALYVAGVCDGASVIVRRAILRFCSPEEMRGRIAAVKSVFVGSSNEIGALESGFAASLLGTGAAIWSGGLVTLAVVAVTALAAPRLLRLDLAAMAAAEPPPGAADAAGSIEEVAGVDASRVTPAA